jgi:hypothetical protein
MTLLLECTKCKYKDVPENFNAFISYTNNYHNGETGLLVIVTSECPVCQNQQMIQHFKANGEMVITNAGVIKYTFSHKTHPHSVMDLPKEKKNEALTGIIKELRNKYLNNLAEAED